MKSFFALLGVACICYFFLKRAPTAAPGQPAAASASSTSAAEGSPATTPAPTPTAQPGVYKSAIDRAKAVAGKVQERNSAPEF